MITAKVSKNSSDIEDDYSEFESCLGKIYKDLKRLEPARKAAFAGKSLDMMFIIDCTGSMSSWIEASKTEIRSIIDCLINQFYGI